MITIYGLGKSDNAEHRWNQLTFYQCRDVGVGNPSTCVYFGCLSASLQALLLNPWQPKVFGVKFRSRDIGKIFSTKIRIFKLRKITKLFNFGFPEGWYFWNCDNTELKRSSEIFFSVSGRHRWAGLRGLPILNERQWPISWNAVNKLPLMLRIIINPLPTYPSVTLNSGPSH